jgi:hypothetical protein
MNHASNLIPPADPKEAPLQFGGRVQWGRASFGPGQRVGVEPMAVRIELPPGHGECPSDWFYLGQTSEASLQRELATGFIPESLWIECYRQAWLREKHRPCPDCKSKK